MSGSAGERTRRVLGWTSLLWFTSAVGFAAGNKLALEAPLEVNAGCGDNVTLTCDARIVRTPGDSSAPTLDIIKFAWLDGKKTLCQTGAEGAAPGDLCEVTAGASHHRLTLTLLNLMPVNEGKYICKLRSRLGSVSNVTNLTITHCPQLLAVKKSASVVENSTPVVERSTTAGGRRDRLHWICVLVAVITFKSVT